MTDVCDSRRERTVDHLQELYLIVIALALAKVVETLANTVDLDWPTLESALRLSAFVVIMLPLYHRTMRYWTRCMLFVLAEVDWRTRSSYSTC